MTGTPAQVARMAKARAARQLKAEPRIPENAREITKPTRAQMTHNERRRRKVGSLNRMAQFKLDIFDPEQLDPNYIYRWITDDGSRIRQVTKADDYDFVNASEIRDFNPQDESDSEGGERIRMLGGKDRHGNAQYQYLLKKRKDFWEEDNAAGQDFREAQLEGRVYEAAVGTHAEEKGAVTDADKFYVPPEATLGSAGRRRGPIQP